MMKSKLDLTTQVWSEFIIEDIFDVDKGIYLHSKNITSGSTPYITAKATENGLNGFIGNEKLFAGNAITIEKIKLSAFYQPHEFYCSHDVTVIRNKYLNRFNAIFICQQINRNGIKYSYGRQAQMNVVKREKILLPSTTNGKMNHASNLEVEAHLTCNCLVSMAFTSCIQIVFSFELFNYVIFLEGTTRHH